jgi:hypothetical protein
MLAREGTECVRRMGGREEVRRKEGGADGAGRGAWKDEGDVRTLVGLREGR